MERHSPLIRCLHLVLLSACYVATVNGYKDKFGMRTSTDLDPALFCSKESNHTWLCEGDEFLAVPSNLTVTSDIIALKIRYAGIKILPDGSLSPYAGTLRKLHMANVPEFQTLAPRIFRNMTKLRTIYISHAPKLTHIDKEVFNVYLPQLREIQILSASLVSVPYLENLITQHILDTVDFENNKIRRINTLEIRIRSSALFLSRNEIVLVDSMAFNGSHIKELSLQGNKKLTNIHKDAFAGLVNIESLDLSGTAITTLPTNGLASIKTLIINDTKTMKKFPSRYEFKKLTQANLTYPHHCCAFEFPAKHDPVMYELQTKLKNQQQNCSAITLDSSGGGRMFGPPVTSPTVYVDPLCDGWYETAINVTCFPKPDAFNPCEDIMGSWWLRVPVWVVAILAMLGNLAVLIVLISMRVDMTVPKFLMCNLAFADLCMGFYLTLIAGMDAVTMGEYLNYAIDWQNGLGCKVAGFLTVFSTELSIFTLTVITSERWYTITYSIHLNKRLKLKTSMKIMAAGWFYACIMAALPLADVSGYGPTSICLPLANRDTKDLIYLITLLVFNGLAFLMIVVCYGRMYSSVQSSRDEATPMARTDMSVAKKMALLVFTDFVCWAPIAFFAITTLAGRPLICVPEMKILLVFVYPLNSCANPYLYALLTHQYRRDVCIFLSRHGMCKDRAAKYKGITTGCSSRPTSDRPKNCGVMLDKRTTSNRQSNAAYNNDRTSDGTMPGGTVVNNCQSVVEELPMTQKGRAENGRCDTTSASSRGVEFEAK